MKLATFFDKFELFADAPDAVGKIRSLILQLAIKGKLNADGDEPGFPQVRLDSLGAWAQGCGFPISEQGHAGRPILFSKVSDMNLPGNEREIIATTHTIDEATSKRLRIKVHPPGTVVFPKIGGAIATNKRRVLIRPTAIDNNCSGLIPSKACSTDWLFLVLSAIDFAEYQSGTSVPSLNQSALGEIEVSLPPSDEQKRIVATVDELMALCDRLEAQQQERQKRHTALARASLARFSDAPTSANLHLLFQPSFSLTSSELRRAILRQVFLGQMRWGSCSIESDPSHVSRLQVEHRNVWEAAQSMTFREKQAVPKSQLWKKRYVAPELPASVGLPDIPDHWTWIPLELACPTIIDSPHRTPVYADQGEYPALRPRDVTGGVLKLSQSARVEASEYERQTERRKPCRGDIVYSRELSFGWAVILPDKPLICLSQGMVSMKAASEVDTSFLCQLLNSPIGRDQAESVAIGAAHPHVNLKDIRAFYIPLPPLGEQRWIVTKVDQLMALVDQLEEKINNSRMLGKRLLEAAIYELVQTSSVSNPSTSVIDRAAIVCYALNRMRSNPSFARTAEVKVLYLAEAHLGLPLGGEYYREAAGPFDKWIYDFERQADKEGWFTTSSEKLTDGRSITRYQLQPGIQAKVDQAAIDLADKRDEFDRMLDCFKTLSTEEIEIIATLFAAWNDALIDGDKPTDDWIIREVRENWHPRKLRFGADQLRDWLSWMRTHLLMPIGNGPRTKHQIGFQLAN